MFAAVLEEDLHRLTDAALAEELVEIRRRIDLLEADFVRRLAVFDRRQGYLADGAVTMVSWLRRRCRLTVGAAAQRLGIARRLPQLPQTEAAFNEGQIGYEHVRVIANASAEIGVDSFRVVEPDLLETAKKVDPGRTWLEARRLRFYIDREGALKDANDAFELRKLYLSQTLDGMFRLDGWLDPEGGACLQSALSSLIGPGSGDDLRPVTQRRADALVELARQRLERGGLPEVAGQRPHLSLISKPGMLYGDLEWAGVVPGETVRRLACDAALTVIQEGADGDPVGVGRTSRTVPPSIRRALVLRDRGCRFPGCDRPPDWTDGHHIEHWADGGEHTLPNLVLLCRRHHRRVHEEGWRLAWSHDRELVALPP